MPNVEVAIWHPNLNAKWIESRVGIPARISFSFGDKRRSGSGYCSETYCRFNIGVVSRVENRRDLLALERFRSLLLSRKFAVPESSCVAYFSLEGDESEIFLGHDAIDYLASMGLGVVFR